MMRIQDVNLKHQKVVIVENFEDLEKHGFVNSDEWTTVLVSLSYNKVTTLPNGVQAKATNPFANYLYDFVAEHEQNVSDNA